jgi:hypothetical protein
MYKSLPRGQMLIIVFNLVNRPTKQANKFQNLFFLLTSTWEDMKLINYCINKKLHLFRTKYEIK